MSTNFKKAGSVIRNSFRSKRYVIFDAEENNYILSPKKKTESEREETRTGRKRQTRNISTTACSDENGNITSLEKAKDDSQSKLKKGTSSVTQSVRVAVGTLRQKLKMSTRRGQSQTTPKRAGKRHQALGSHEVHLYSPFKIDTPKGPCVSHIKTCLTMETPTRLRREVESLTTNMQALSTLTPNTLRRRSNARKSPLLTNRSLRTPRSTRKRIVLED